MRRGYTKVRPAMQSPEDLDSPRPSLSPSCLGCPDGAGPRSQLTDSEGRAIIGKRYDGKRFLGIPLSSTRSFNGAARSDSLPGDGDTGGAVVLLLRGRPVGRSGCVPRG